MNKHKIKYLKFSLYCISLWLLMLMLIVLKVDISVFKEGYSIQIWFMFIKENIFSMICLFIIILGIVGYICFKDTLNNTKGLPVEIVECNSVTHENLSFLATYIIPLVCFPMCTKRQVVILFAVITIIGFIFVKTNQYYTNPSLALLGFNAYSVTWKTDTGPESGIVIVRGTLNREDIIKYMSLSDNIYYARRVESCKRKK